MPKRRRDDHVPETILEEEEGGVMTPSKRRTIDVETPSKHAEETPSKQRSILKPASGHIQSAQGTPKSLRKVLFSTPAKAGDIVTDDGLLKESPLTAARNADRSARRKSNKRLFDPEDEEETEETVLEDALAREILDSEAESEEQAVEEIAVAPGTPSKSGTGKPRGRPKGSKKKEPSPTPHDLPPHELYFFQNRPGGVKTSTNTLPSNALLNHDDYFAQVNTYQDPHEKDREFLTDMHRYSFDQWLFELDQGFNICVYGYGSKRDLLLDFADHIFEIYKKPNIIIINGYSPNITPRDVLTAIAKHALPPSIASKLPLQPALLLDSLLQALTSAAPNATIHLILHSLDSVHFRKPLFQSTLSRLSSHPSIHLIASADTPTFPILWDISQRLAFRFLFHDTTTFSPYTAELDPVEEVNALLGRSGRRVGGKDGVAYVLRSLPENARALFRILVAEQLALADMDPITQPASPSADGNDLLGQSGSESDSAVQTANTTKPKGGRGRPAKRAKPSSTRVPHQAVTVLGVEYRTLYHKAVEEFICSSEMSFRTLLKEFHDHDMVESRKDGLGTERLSVPFGRQELEELLEELV